MTKLAILNGEPAVTLKKMCEPGEPNWSWEYPIIEEEEIRAVVDVLKSRRLCSLTGAKVKEFEHKFADYIGVDYAIAFSSGTSALHAAVVAAEAGPGDEVIVPAYTFIASAVSILYNNAIPVFVDVDPKTYNIDPEEVEKAITPKTKAVIAVDFYGHPADRKPLLEICEKNGLVLIGDCAQSHGATYDGKKTGSIEHVACFSFQESKNLPCGEGGMLVTNDPKLAAFASRVRIFGEKLIEGKAREYISYDLGYNYRLTEIQAAIGIEQLKRLDENNETRRKNVAMLSEHLAKIPGVEPPYVAPNVQHAYYSYALKHNEEETNVPREVILGALRAEGVPVYIYQKIPLYKQPVFQNLDCYGKGCPFNCPNARKVDYSLCSCPVTEDLCRKVYNFFVNPPMDTDLAKQYIEAIQKVYENVDELKKHEEEITKKFDFGEWGGMSEFKK